jgi:hypothetical protein
LEEKFDGFELHHILRRDNEAANALARLRSSCEPPPSSVFMQDLFKPSIRLKEHIPAPTPGFSPGEDSLTPMSGTLPDKDGATPISKAGPRNSIGPIGQAQEPGGDITTIVRSSSPNTDW